MKKCLLGILYICVTDNYFVKLVEKSGHIPGTLCLYIFIYNINNIIIIIIISHVKFFLLNI